MMLLKVIVVAIFTWIWLKSMNSRTAAVSDFCVMSFLAIYMPGFPLNPGEGLHSSGVEAC